MRYRILGPLSVTVDGQEVAVTASRDRVVLAMFLLHPGRVLGVGVLADALWGADPPATARGQLQTCVSRLRRMLPAGAIHSDPAGYRLVPGPGELDAAEFARLVTAAREQRDPVLYRQALDLWHGEALTGIDSHAVRLAAAVLDQQHVAAVQDWADLELAAGPEPGLIGRLIAAVDRFPLQERLSGQLMRALHQAGRQAEALAEFRRVTAALRHDLGLDPGAELRELHDAMLHGRLDPPSRAGPPIRCLPRTVGDFTGRRALVERMVTAIEQAGPGPIVAVVDGMAGSGKTTLALHVASLLGDRYPDAHLFVDLHGHSAEQPLEPSAVLLVLLRQLGVSAERIPPALVDRVGLWRTELAERRVLVLFDNAASSAQLADLLPTAPGSLALVTGRRRLLGLDGVQTESLPVLDADEAVTLLARIAGSRVWAEPEAAAEVVRRCGALPLAIRLAGSRLAHRPRWRVADLVHRLGDSALPELAAEDRSVASAFAVSYGHLPDPVRDVFRLLGVGPANEFDALTAAALTGLPLPTVQDALDELVDVHLVEEPEPGVYRLHDLLREFAAALAAEIPAADRTEALRGLLDQQLHAAAATVRPGLRGAVERDIGVLTPMRPDLLAAVTDPSARLDRERPHLVDYVEAAAGVPELIDYAWKLPRAAWRFLFERGYLDDVRRTNERALSALDDGENRGAIATVLNYLASVHYRSARLDEAIRMMERCIALRQEIGDRHAAASALVNLAVLYSDAGLWIKSNEIALEVRRTSVPRHGRDELNVLANNYQRLGQYPQALRYHRLRLMAQLDIRDPTRLGDTLLNLAVVKHGLGLISLATARRKVEVSLRFIERAGLPHEEAEAQHALALLLADEGRTAESATAHQRGITIAERMGNREQEARMLCGLGSTRMRAGDRTGARSLFERALEAGLASGLPHPIAVAKARLGGCLITDDPAAARRLLGQARAELAALEAPELADVEKSLAELGGTGGEDHLRSRSGRETMES
ncbi:tetratricopeptide repeat protein [Actinoplanes bogorensis]|uniref:Tetratricopeptide repeat protein n=1 Tax=Paractinoplanes bogorensis TaxID=1610840 RepID=A0ABS5YI97_9ACTN|nr:AfsR/SARP family transcriptional regulator [Actinoplanes bogorensis]MBU2663207.1 tetratricopeptide repeat protein [Actinoplanes bogorensis]